MHYFCSEIKWRKEVPIMLGMNSPRELISGSFAREVKLSLERALTKKPTEAEKEIRQELKDTEKEWTAVWA